MQLTSVSGCFNHSITVHRIPPNNKKLSGPKCQSFAPGSRDPCKRVTDLPLKSVGLHYCAVTMGNLTLAVKKELTERLILSSP